MKMGINATGVEKMTAQDKKLWRRIDPSGSDTEWKKLTETEEVKGCTDEIVFFSGLC